MNQLSTHLYLRYRPLVEANNVACTYAKQGNFMEAIPHIEIALKYVTLQKPSFIKNKEDEKEILPVFRAVCGLAGYILYGNVGNDELSLLCYQRAWYLRFQVKTFSDKNPIIKLYQFRGYSEEKTYAVKNLQNYQISLADP